ncbi:MAG: hypothetical protein IANPNBLG_02888 [Bryobacteraceae bacterium]|nr:hypothetical protein [Bryobacteraceae bacterium]
MSHGNKVISIWFFIGALLLIYGILITGAGIHGLAHPPTTEVVLSNLHAAIWWGALLIVLGAVYLYLYAPSRKNRS